MREKRWKANSETRSESICISVITAALLEKLSSSCGSASGSPSAAGSVGAGVSGRDAWGDVAVDGVGLLDDDAISFRTSVLA